MDVITPRVRLLGCENSKKINTRSAQVSAGWFLPCGQIFVGIVDMCPPASPQFETESLRSTRTWCVFASEKRPAGLFYYHFLQPNVANPIAPFVASWPPSYAAMASTSLESWLCYGWHGQKDGPSAKYQYRRRTPLPRLVGWRPSRVVG